MTSIDPKDLLAASSPAWSLCGSEPSNVSTRLAEPKSPSSAGTAFEAIVMLPMAAGDGHGEKREDQEVLPPVATGRAAPPSGRPPGGRPCRRVSVAER